MREDIGRSELIRKYRWAGKIRLLSALLLFLFLLLMKFVGGYSYLNPYVCALILVEAVLNQPYTFLLKKADIRRFQYFQMLTDLIAVSWILYYMGGVAAPVVSMGYYIVILWAGVVAGQAAVFFASLVSSVLFSAIALLTHYGILLRPPFSEQGMPTSQIASLVVSNLAFFFAFGYFSARSSNLIKALERRRQEESLKNAHRLMATGYLIGKTAHDIQGCLAAIKGGMQVLQVIKERSDEEKKFMKTIEEMERRGANLIERLAIFSRKPKEEFGLININEVIENSLDLLNPIIRYSKMSLEKKFIQDILLINADKDQMQEVFVVFILNALDSVALKPQGGALTIKTECIKDKGVIEIVFADTGIGIRPDDLKKIGEPFFSTKEPEKGAGLGLTTAFGIIERHGGKIEVKSKPGEGATFIIRLPLNNDEKHD